MDDEGKGTGKLSKRGVNGIRTGHDKLREMKKVMQKHRYSNDFFTVYVGDSNTDLPCLLFADVGIIIGKGGSLIEICKRAGLNVFAGAKLNEIVRSSKETRNDKRLYHFKDWNEILEAGLLE
jgi:phosphoserine phosphatase